MLKGGHDVLGRRDCGKQPLWGVVVRRPGEAFCNPVRRPHTLAGPGQQAVGFTGASQFCFVFFPLKWDRMATGSWS